MSIISNNYNYKFILKDGQYLTDQPAALALGWQIDKKNILDSKWSDRHIKKFCLNFIDGTIYLVKPRNEPFSSKIAEENHSLALGLAKNNNQADPKSFTANNYVRCFYDHKTKAAGIRTPWVEGFDEHGWTEATKAKTNELQAKAALFLRIIIPDMLIVSNIGNKDIGREEVFRLADILNLENRLIKCQ